MKFNTTMPQLNLTQKGYTTMSTINPTQTGAAAMLPLNPILATLGKLQAHTAVMSQLTQSAQGDVISINRRDLQRAFADIQETISGVCDQLSEFDESEIAFVSACREFEQTLSESAPVAPVIEMTEPCIVRRRFSQKDEVRQFYVPSISEEQVNKCSSSAVGSRYGVELPAYYHDIDVSRFAEKTYYDENGDQQRVLIPLFKERREGEHTQAFYQRVGLLLPPID